MGSVASIDLYYADREAKRFDDDFGVEDIDAMIVDNEDVKISDYSASFSNVIENRKSQEVYEFCLAVRRGETPSIDDLYNVLCEGTREEAEDLGVWVL